MKIINGLRKNLLSILTIIAFFWWITANDYTSPLAFYTFAVLYAGYYVDWARRNPVVPKKRAKQRIQFDVVLVILMIASIAMGDSDVLAIAGGVIFVIGILGADFWLYRKAKKNVGAEAKK